ncbi:hypothetical protein G3A_00910 [Bacillus sp. 17376]|uniref:DUF4179 domain-containing protein n=1 Tax=Mesobacillus boroniphilus JCM 21738 TaxID=1294265 RepID=W4RW86_9BACI|nr:DUF4179 domain-containing protein [Mesobacillus boroniphilus]ESU34470.1 hypothetical protein G3A_00910 [Bacillus sp. 17376]GAE48382.1 hypothetical protein JCM21738_5499 [Mesobacillus boroniphilus JCM 21738]
MEKKMFHESVNQIEVPEADVLNAIQGGVRKGSKMRAKQKSRFKVLGASVAAAAVLFVASGFMVPSVGNVMADIPFLAKLYEHDKVAGNLASQELITELNEKAAFDGIDVRVTEAYYDGAIIGVTFDVKGEVKGDEDAIYAFYEIFDRDSNIEETMELVKLLPAEGGYKGHIQLSYPRAELPAETTLPFKIIGIGEINDNWKDEQAKWNFDVPIKQLPFETAALEQASELGDYKITFEKLITGKSSTAIEYTMSYPEEGQRVMLDLFDDKGEQIIGGTSDAKIEKKIENGTVTEKRRITIPMVLDSDFIEVKPALESGEKLDSVKIDL